MKTTLMALFAVGLFLFGSTAEAQFSVPASPQHKLLKMDVGTWDAKMKMWMGADGQTDPSAEPTTGEGTEVNRMIGEFWLLSEFKADISGMPFEGSATVGFDPQSKKFVGSWVDSMNPGASHMEGTYDEKTRTMTSMMVTMTPDGERKAKSTVVYDGDNKRVMTMYDLKPGTDGEWVRSMEIVYTRKSD